MSFKDLFNVGKTFFKVTKTVVYDIPNAINNLNVNTSKSDLKDYSSFIQDLEKEYLTNLFSIICIYIENVFQENLNNEKTKIESFENLSNYLQDSINTIQEFQKSNSEIRSKVIGNDLNNNEKYTNLLVFLSELNVNINKLINYLNSTFAENKRYDEIRYQYDKFLQQKINFRMDN
jgi:hypothetical protein